MFQCLRRELTWCQRSPEDHSAAVNQPSHVSLLLSPQTSRVCHGRFYRPVILSLLTWSSCRRPRRPRQSLLFSVWTADDLSAAVTRDRNTVLLYGAESRCPEVLPFSGVAPSWDTKLLHGHGRGTLGSAVLTLFCSLGFHTLGVTL